MFFYVKALHIIFVVTWFSGLFYIVRLFVYSAEANEKSEPERSILLKQFGIMQKRLWYGITWPYGDFLRYDLKTEKLKDFGTVFHGGELGSLGSTYRAICRRIVVDPDDGSAYFTTGDGTIHRYDYDKDKLETVKGVNLKKDYFGVFDPSKEGMAYNWRAAVWVPSQRAIYGVNGRSGYLFRFDPNGPSVEVLKRLTSEPSQRTGMFNQSEYGYLGLALGTGGHTLYYLTGAPLPRHSKDPSNKGTKNESSDEASHLKEGTHLITYEISSGKYVDHGEILLNDGEPIRPPQSLVIGQDGTLYALTYIARTNSIDLISFHP